MKNEEGRMKKEEGRMKKEELPAVSSQQSAGRCRDCRFCFEGVCMIPIYVDAEFIDELVVKPDEMRCYLFERREPVDSGQQPAVSE